MNLSKYGLLAGLLTVMSFSGLVGGHFGYAVNGVPQGADISAAAPGILGIVEWVWDSIVFLFNRYLQLSVAIECLTKKEIDE